MDRNDIIKDLGLETITPVDFIDGLYIKREDLFKPFSNSTVI